MIQPKTQLRSKSRVWSLNDRYRPLETVEHANYYWYNTSGANGEPGISNDWFKGARTFEASSLTTMIDVNEPNSPIGQFVFGTHPNINDGGYFLGKIISLPATWPQIDESNLQIHYRN